MNFFRIANFVLRKYEILEVHCRWLDKFLWLYAFIIDFFYCFSSNRQSENILSIKILHITKQKKNYINLNIDNF